MEDILQRAGSQAVTFAIRSGISIASGYAIKTLSRFMEKIPEGERSSLEMTKSRLQTKITIITPAIDLIELVSARGNTSLGSTLELTQTLKADIDEFETRINKINDRMASSSSASLDKETLRMVKQVEEYSKDLLSRIEESIPLISLALTTSGANLSARMPDSVSPGRLLQAANHVTNADTLFTGSSPVQVGPPFVLKLYTIFYGTARNPHATISGDITWKEEHAKCKVTVWRVPAEYESADAYEYQMKIEEDLNDERYHDDDDEPRVRVIDLSIVTRLFFSASGRLLEIEESKTPVLVLKLNPLDEDDGRIEWLAFEDYNTVDYTDNLHDNDDDEEEDDNEEEGDSDSTESGSESEGDSSMLINRLNGLSLSAEPTNPASLSLLEYIVRLCALQANDQESMYTISDERISLYLRDETADDAGNKNPATNPNSPSLLYKNSTPHGHGHSSSSNRRHERLGRKGGAGASPASSLAMKQQTSSSSTSSTPASPAPRTPSKPGASTGSPVALTPWEKDRLSKKPLRRQLLQSAKKYASSSLE